MRPIQDPLSQSCETLETALGISSDELAAMNDCEIADLFEDNSSDPGALWALLKHSVPLSRTCTIEGILTPQAAIRVVLGFTDHLDDEEFAYFSDRLEREMEAAREASKERVLH